MHEADGPRAGWGYLAQRGDSETNTMERFGPLHDSPDNLLGPGTIPSTNNIDRYLNLDSVEIPTGFRISVNFPPCPEYGAAPIGVVPSRLG